MLRLNELGDGEYIRRNADHGTCWAMERTVGAALRGRPRVEIVFAESEAIDF
jgi:hypothetical protein